MSWAEETYKAIKEKELMGISLTEDDYDALYYCEECFTEDARDAEYLGSYSVVL